MNLLKHTLSFMLINLLLPFSLNFGYPDNPLDKFDLKVNKVFYTYAYPIAALKNSFPAGIIAGQIAVAYKIAPYIPLIKDLPLHIDPKITYGLLAAAWLTSTYVYGNTLRTEAKSRINELDPYSWHH